MMRGVCRLVGVAFVLGLAVQSALADARVPASRLVVVDRVGGRTSTGTTWARRP
jgi:hypothetical protein